MDIKVYLYLTKEIKIAHQIQQYASESLELKNAAIAIGSFDYTKDKVISSPSPHANYENLIDKSVELERRIYKLINEWEKVRQNMRILFAELPDLEQEIAVLCYIDHCKHKKVWQRMGISKSTFYRLKKQTDADILFLLEEKNV